MNEILNKVNGIYAGGWSQVSEHELELVGRGLWCGMLTDKPICRVNLKTREIAWQRVRLAGAYYTIVHCMLECIFHEN